MAALGALALIATRTVWGEIVRTGLSTENQSHILLAPIVAMWLAWLRRGRLRYCRFAPSPAGPLAIAAGWALSAYGFRNGYDILWHFGAILVVGGAVVTVIGLSLLRKFAPSFLALLFLLPVPGRINNAIAGPLQNITAQVGEWSLQILGLPVARLGSKLIVNGHEVLVAEACNGMRMVSALALIAFAFVFSTPMRNGIRLLILVLTPLLAILVNLIRMIPTVLLYGYADVDIATLFHDLSGWVSLGVALALLWATLGFLRWLEVPIARVAITTQ